MKIVQEETLLSCGKYAASATWKMTRKSLYKAIRGVDWPRGAGTFTIYPESGKRRHKGNGVTPIKLGLMEQLQRKGWKLEEPLDLATLKKPGNWTPFSTPTTVLSRWSGRPAISRQAIVR